MRIIPIALTIAVPVALASLAASAYALVVGLGGGVEADTPSAGAPVGPGSEEQALRAAAVEAGIAVKVPTYFATSARQLVWVDSSAGPESISDSGGLVELIYQSEETVEQEGYEVPASLVEIFVTRRTLAEPNGDLVARDIAGYTVFEYYVGASPGGEREAVSYTATNGTETIIISFEGEIPARDDVMAMLDSFETAAAP